MRHKAFCAALCLAVAAAFLSQPVVAAPGQGPDPAKRAERRQKVLEKFDRNGNGQLDPDEREAAREAMQKRRAEGGGAKGQGDGGPAPERRQKLLEKFDTDGDGQLSESERAAAKAAKGARAKKGR
jgi:hypothetical protein